MNQPKKLLGEERRQKLLDVLKTSGRPVTGSELSRMANVSRQVIVSDITLLKAKKEPIIATSQGYLYMTPQEPGLLERVITCSHTPDRTEEELNLLVDLGILVKDVRIEHPVYGDLTASIMVSSRREVRRFLDKIEENDAALLSQLSHGVHLHTISAATEEQLNEAETALRNAGFLLDPSH